MRLSRRHGAVRLRFDAAEAGVLAALLDDFGRLLRQELAAEDPVRQRLFPAAYLDEDAAVEFRELTESTLRDERTERAETCRTELAGRELTLQPEDAERWIKTLNDLRLVVGTRLEITEDDDQQLDPQAPDAQARSVYYWLTYLQDALVQALLR